MVLTRPDHLFIHNYIRLLLNIILRPILIIWTTSGGCCLNPRRESRVLLLVCLTPYIYVLAIYIYIYVCVCVYILCLVCWIGLDWIFCFISYIIMYIYIYIYVCVCVYMLCLVCWIGLDWIFCFISYIIMYIYIYIYIPIDTQAVGHEFDPRPDH